MGLVERAIGVLRAADGGLCAAFGGYWWESISGTAERGAVADKWWGHPLVALIECQPWFGAGHCAAQAAKEAVMRELILGTRL